MSEKDAERAVDSVFRSGNGFCKFLSANDSGETGGHQSGILISNSAKNLLFSKKEQDGSRILKKNIRVRWQGDFFTDSCFSWYESKHEQRITKFGKSFPFLRPEYTGSLFILTKQTDTDYEGFFLNTEEDIQLFLDSFGLSPADTNRPISINNNPFLESKEKNAIQKFITSIGSELPSAREMSSQAEDIYAEIYRNGNLVTSNPDRIIIDWMAQEYRLFKTVELSKYGDTVINGFNNFDDFIILANQVLNRRKSRAGKSLEYHIASILNGNGIRYTSQGITEGNKRPDFIFPSIEDYHNSAFSVEGLCTLAAKTTCKDRWRQVLNEADRLKDRNKYLCTFQQGISSAQMDEMEAEKVILVVPKEYISSYPRDRQNRIWTIKKFISYVKELEDLK